MLLTRRLKKDFTYRNLGGKAIQLEFEISKEDVLQKMAEGNWACYNFMERRTDFNIFFQKKLYYGKVDGLGYVVAEDEFE